MGQPGDKSRAPHPHKDQDAPSDATHAEQKGPRLEAALCRPQAAPAGLRAGTRENGKVRTEPPTPPAFLVGGEKSAPAAPSALE